MMSNGQIAWALCCVSFQATAAFTCGHKYTPPMHASHRSRAFAAPEMLSSFQDMMKKLQEEDEQKVESVPTPPPAAPVEGSLAARMFGSVADGLKGIAEATGLGSDEDEGATAGGSTRPFSEDEKVSDLDARAQTGDLSFRDFLTLSETFAKMGGKSVPGMPTMSAAQLAETREKFAKHEKIVEAMLPDELDEPDILMGELRESGNEVGPRMQRLATATALPENEVGLFLMQFEAMRESTKRIAEGEDPDAVTATTSAPPGSNRKVRRAAEKEAARAAKKKAKRAGKL
jgi:hypothetical protein